MTKVELVAVPSGRETPGIYYEDMGSLGVKEGNWVAISTETGKISTKVRGMERDPAWKPQLVFLEMSDLRKLGLDKKASGTVASNPNPAAKVLVSRLMFPRDSKFTIAIVTLALAVITALVAFIASNSNLAKLVLSSLTAIVAFISALSNKQSV